ncbi:conserved hypothetical protein [Segniliparus rotundus DSM 44985]|uniref:DUF4873 domain-containing protein n=1 Tax=Segniliparus rotundus (strain ATCC BAA-972 / CDC 1076 / CIP 108378 / DSM 44985 / JCM 13578) TaxID=640132 RepID=D6ZBS0_SEGRD|nr:DUF4873 domain-containing protein [Segniliparus rotundus]ADG96897.1 conserved hypothetical protein [Segniliparus rotundus DSM 44985]
MIDAHAEHDYEGPVQVEVDGHTFTAQAVLRGHQQPLDGRFRWYGRIKADAALKEIVGERANGSVTTEHGTAKGVLDDLDFWDRYRVVGRSRPPFHVPSSIEEAEAEAAEHEAQLLASQSQGTAQ